MSLQPARAYYEVRKPDGSPLHEPPHLWPTWDAAWRFAGHSQRRSLEAVDEAIGRLKKEGFTCAKVKLTNW